MEVLFYFILDNFQYFISSIWDKFSINSIWIILQIIAFIIIQLTKSCAHFAETKEKRWTCCHERLIKGWHNFDDKEENNEHLIAEINTGMIDDHIEW